MAAIIPGERPPVEELVDAEGVAVDAEGVVGFVVDAKVLEDVGPLAFE
jgi:hypothetical protein